MTGVLVGVAVVAALSLLLQAYRSVSPAARESALRAVLAEACELASGYQARNRRCPPSLGDLPLTFPDGGTPADLEALSYEREGRSCTIAWRAPDGRTFACDVGEES